MIEHEYLSQSIILVSSSTGGKTADLFSNGDPDAFLSLPLRVSIIHSHYRCPHPHVKPNEFGHTASMYPLLVMHDRAKDVCMESCDVFACE